MTCLRYVRAGVEIHQESLYQTITSTYLGVCECEPLASFLNGSDTHQLRERLCNGFNLLPVYGKLCTVPEVMTPGIVTTVKVQLNPHRLPTALLDLLW